MFYSFLSQEFTSPLNLSCFCFNILVVTFIISTFTLTMSSLDLFFLTTDIYLSSLLCSTMSSISLFILSFLCCPGFNSSSPTINNCSYNSETTMCMYFSLYIHIMIVHQQLAFHRPKKLVLAPYIPMCTPISHYFLHICSRSHLNCNPLH